MKKNKSTLNDILNQTIELERIDTFRLGTIVNMDLEKNLIWVDYNGNPYTKPVLARLGTPWINSDDFSLFRNKIDSVKIDFLNGNPSQPIIRDLYFSLNEMNRSKSQSLKDKLIEVEADEIVIKGRKQITIQCGDTKTVFKADTSEIVQEADQIKSSARKNNKIKGSVVLLN